MKKFVLCLLVICLLITTGTSITWAAQNKPVGSKGYALALFPVKVMSPWGEGYLRRTEILAIEGIAKAVADDVLLKFKYTYLETSDTAGAVALADATGRGSLNVWRQMSLLSNFSPDWSRVKTICAEIDADLAVLIRVRKDENSLVDVYLYDSRQNKIYSKTSKGVYWGSLATGIRQLAEALLQDFYDQQ